VQAIAGGAVKHVQQIGVLMFPNTTLAFSLRSVRTQENVEFGLDYLNQAKGGMTNSNHGTYIRCSLKAASSLHNSAAPLLRRMVHCACLHGLIAVHGCRTFKPLQRQAAVPNFFRSHKPQLLDTQT
jgi:hypothetical protein